MNNQNFISEEEKEFRIAQAVTVTAELTGTVLSPTALNVMIEDLMVYDVEAVERALTRCRRELSGRLSLAAIIERIDTGMPSADEAWALLVDGFLHEELTAVLPEMAQLAAGESRAWELFKNGDRTGARMAFKDKYNVMAVSPEWSNQPVKWVVSAGTDKVYLEMKIKEAVGQGKLSKSEAIGYLPCEAVETRLLYETNQVLSLEDKEKGMRSVANMLNMLADKMAMNAEMKRQRQEAEREYSRKVMQRYGA